MYRVFACLLSLQIALSHIELKMSHLASKTEKQADELVSKQTELGKVADTLSEKEQMANSAKQEAKISEEAALALQDNFRRTKSHNEQLELKLKETRDELSDSQISQHKLQTMNVSLRSGEYNSCMRY